MTMARLTLVVAYARNRVIGRDNTLPWRLPGDLAHFKRTTLGHPIVMGRNTWESLGRPLPGRQNIVVSRNPDYRAEGARVVPDLQAALDAAEAEDVYVIGGAQIYAQALPLADRIIATEIQADVDGDAWFPLLPGYAWKETSRQPQPEENGYRYHFVVYERAAA
ncbi:dihydrofolate reductase [Bordetella hinzii]|uniref:dihydrofolate reductase n=1 Tax=Bordetella hinzii TaxID=103855 RepID=UPI000426EAAA|nr:dihydrofolate reductase [Bordetella hinzii]AKQ54063.1 Dihydrofolate reductase type 3 [Bordetella hinzii]KCB30624.1 dihydrofolate reductase [Bordetella hinzii L60]SNV97670.1 dihydrofolate reductase [Bordetella hinzii]